MFKVMTITIVFAVILFVSGTALGQSIKKVATVKHESGLFGIRVAVSRDGGHIAIEARGNAGTSVSVYDIKANRAVGTFQAEGGSPCGFAISSSPLQVAYCNVGGVDEKPLQLWWFNPTAGTFEVKHAFESSSSGDLSFTADGKKLFSSSGDLTLHDLESGAILRRPSSRKRFWQGQMSPDAKFLAFPFFQDVEIEDRDSGRSHASLLDHNGRVDSIAFSPDGRTLAVGVCRSDARYQRLASEITLWDVASGKAKASTKGFPGGIGWVCHPHARLIACYWRGNLDLDTSAEIKIYDLQTDRWTTALRLPSDRLGRTMSVSPSGCLVLIGTETVEAYQMEAPQ